MKITPYIIIAFCLMYGLSCSSSKRGEYSTASQEIPGNCPFAQSNDFSGLQLGPGFKNYLDEKITSDTWYPSWASDGNMYSPWTDGKVRDLQSNSAGIDATTGIATLAGDDPMNLTIVNEAVYKSDPSPYQSRYPCGTLVYNGIWYYGTYCLYGDQVIKKGSITYNWPWMGPFVGFRHSTDYGRNWTNCPLTPEKSLFNETGINGYPVKIGSPHFVDFGKNMQYSPDGKAYLVAHGADATDTQWRFWNDSWITGDQIYLFRVTPSVENINDVSKYDFFAGTDDKGSPLWSKDFEKIRPMLEWNNNMGCVTMTYHAPFKRYLLCVTDGGNTCSKMNTYILESRNITGPWKLIAYLKEFGEQAYFVNIPSKFIGKDGKTAWLMYSGNFAPDWNGLKIKENPPGSHYGMVLQKIEFLTNRK